MKHARKGLLGDTLLTDYGGRFEKDEAYDDVQLVGNDISGVEASGVMLNTVCMEKVRMQDSKLEKLKMTDVEMTGCDWANTEVFEGNFFNVEGFACRMTGTKFIKLLAEKLMLEETGGELVQIRFGIIKKTKFSRCNFKGGDFGGTVFSDCEFENCDLSETDFSGTKLTNTSFYGCTIENMRIGLEEIRGAKFDVEQAMKLLGLLGVEIRGFDKIKE